MADVVHGAPQEFWRPPTPELENSAGEVEFLSDMAEACPRCGTEFLLGSGFCHTCGGRRPVAISAGARADAAEMAGLWQQAVDGVHSVLAATWEKIEFPRWLRYLHFHEIKRRAGLSTAPLIAFVIGLACAMGALLVGLSSTKNVAGWQMIQYYRVELLLGATAAFVAGILLKKHRQDGEEGE